MPINSIKQGSHNSLIMDFESHQFLYFEQDSNIYLDSKLKQCHHSTFLASPWKPILWKLIYYIC